MFKNRRLFWLVIIGAAVLSFPTIVRAEDGYCFCGSDLSAVAIEETSKITNGSCSIESSGEVCTAKSSSKDIFKGKCIFYGGGSADQGKTACSDQVTQWTADKIALIKGAASFGNSFRGWTSKLIPECLLKNDLSKSCRDVSIFVYFLIQLARYLFGIIGALALVMFVYGGFMLILSQGSSEKVKKGTEIITAAVIGLVIMFGAYTLVSFLGEAVNIQTEFKLK